MQGIFDMHCHILPGVDDGARSMEEAMAILYDERANGVTDVIMTPHFRREMFETDRGVVYERYLEVLREARREFPEIRLYLGCEFHANMDMEELVLSDPLYRMPDTRHVLLEFSSMHPKSYIKERTYALLSRGFIPILAHVERYPPLHKDMGLISELRDMGAFIQVNANALIGKDGWGWKRFTGKLLKNNLIDFVGSDAHNTSDRTCNIKKAYDLVAKKAGRDTADRIFIENPYKIVKN
ncbi:MAG: capsular biosynthesis protein [Lachnospiraceae bacterium]|nr:capsular biosynthesis protein [Lachnospiraceae bacterium]